MGAGSVGANVAGLGTVAVAVALHVVMPLPVAVALAVAVLVAVVAVALAVNRRAGIPTAPGADDLADEGFYAGGASDVAA